MHNLRSLLDVSLSDDLVGDVDAIASLLLGAPISQVARDNLIASVRSAGATDEEISQIITVGLLACPAFQWR